MSETAPLRVEPAAPDAPEGLPGTAAGPPGSVAQVALPDAPVVAPDAPVVVPDAPFVALDAPVVVPDARVVAVDAPVVALDAPAVGPDDIVVVADAADVLVVDAPTVLPAVGPTGRPLPDFPVPAPLLRHGPARVVALCNQKGGVGKTTSAINLGAAMAEYGRRVLLVDFDPQGALSVGLGVAAHELEHSVFDVLVGSGIGLRDVLIQTHVPGLDLAPSNIDLAAAEMQLVTEVAREQALGRALRPVLDDYDVVLVDCQPSLGLLTVNALTAADGVIVPLECEYFALRGVALLLNTVEKVRDRLNDRLELDGILATMYDARTVHGRQVLERVVERFGDRVFHTVVNRTVRFPETTVAGEPITSFAPSSPGAAAYRALAREVLASWSAR